MLYPFVRNTLLTCLCALLFSACNRGPDRAIVISQVQSAAQLATVEYVLSKVVLGTKEKKIVGLKLKDSDFLAETEARIKAGIDLQKIREEDVKIEGNRIRIHLPPVEILNFSYPAENFKVDFNYYESSRANRLTLDDLEQFYRMGELAIRRDMQFLGIEKTAQQRTRVMLGGLLKAAGYDEVYLEFEPMDYGPAEAYQEAWDNIRNAISGNS
ncbi:MAG: DUF4230 domain-containing protein [Bacteroidota bacterium]